MRLGKVRHVILTFNQAKNIVYVRGLLASVSTSMGTKKGCIYGKGGAIQVGATDVMGGTVAPNCPPPDPPLLLTA